MSDHLQGASLEGVRLKLARAQQHLMALDAEIRTFEQRQPYRISYNREAGGTEHVYRIHVNEGLPVSWSPIIGDCLQNMRSALDHLAHQLEKLSRPNEKPKRQVAFPVCKTKDD